MYASVTNVNILISYEGFALLTVKYIRDHRFEYE